MDKTEARYAFGDSSPGQSKNTEVSKLTLFSLTLQDELKESL